MGVEDLLILGDLLRKQQPFPPLWADRDWLFAAGSRTSMSVYLPRNARTLMRAKQLGGSIKYLSQGEIDARNRGYSPYSTETWLGMLDEVASAGVANRNAPPALR